MISVVTNHRVALDSKDHIYPEGTMKDDTPDSGFLDDLEVVFGGKKLSILDLGCAGGRFIVQAHERGHTAVGLEGSDYSLLSARASWPLYSGKVLFTCDISRPFAVMEQGNRILFDVVTAWEFWEHVPQERLGCAVDNVWTHLKPGALMCATLNHETGVHHRTCKSREWWLSTFAPRFIELNECRLTHPVRLEGTYVVFKRAED